MRTAIRKMGNSSGVIIPKPVRAQIGLEAGDHVDLSLPDDRIVLTPARRHPRMGWAEAAKRLSEAGDDALVWPEFGDADDSDLEW